MMCFTLFCLIRLNTMKDPKDIRNIFPFPTSNPVIHSSRTRRCPPAARESKRSPSPPRAATVWRWTGTNEPR